MTEIAERLARIEEGSKHRDEKLSDLAESVKSIDKKLDEIRDTHIANASSMRTHKVWMGGIAGAAGALAGFLVKYFPGGLPK